jgi:hypothetical protein
MSAGNTAGKHSGPPQQESPFSGFGTMTGRIEVPLQNLRNNRDGLEKKFPLGGS